MAKVELKQPIVDQIAEEIKDAQSVVLVDHRGLTVAQDTELRCIMSANSVMAFAASSVFSDFMATESFSLIFSLSSLIRSLDFSAPILI